MKKLFVSVFSFLIASVSLQAQEVTGEVLKQRIKAYKSDPRGPYKEIRWYCADGSIIPPKERCPQPGGGVQRARHKDEVTKLTETNHIFLGQILATTPFEDFWDEENYHSRLKQYQMEIYLRGIDEGWILRKAQFYRGAYQAEDEEAWGVNFFSWLLRDKEFLGKNYFLIRQAARDIPHNGDNNLKQEIRLTSKVISESYPPFLDLRVKIHGQPDESDVEKLIAFRDLHKGKLSGEELEKMNQLLQNMQLLYKPFDINSLNNYTLNLDEDSQIIRRIKSFQTDYIKTKDKRSRIILLAKMLKDLRQQINSCNNAIERISTIDISILLENLLFNELSGYTPLSLKEEIENVYYLGMASTGCGYMELWEWEELKNRLDVLKSDDITEAELLHVFESCRNITEWGTAMYQAVYEDVISLFSGFEPLAEGFLDEKIRSGILLKTGISISNLGERLSSYFPAKNQVMEIKSPGTIRGLNSGFAKGELVVISGQTTHINFEKDKIYVFNKPPADLKPVAGIATVSEGNPVSHIQLLARNLGIPNAVLSMQNLDDLKQYNGKIVFYAVSPKGVVIMKAEEKMLDSEKQLFEKKVRKEEKISVAVERIDLNQKSVLKLTDVSAISSGIICGPKAANLGQLKLLFPENVVDGMVIPFGIFRDHMNQKMPGSNTSYWEYLNIIFESSGKMRTNGISEEEIETFVMKELKIFHNSVKQIAFSEKFLSELENSFQEVFGKNIGSIPVFIRSDTNMEDLKDFTGAGLNLTIFNIVKREVILQGIRDVWASPYTERSFKWRQRYLNNPENVFPSILIIPSVDVDYSGVLVTKGVGSGSNEDLTVSFSLGVGGAVDGQAAETYLLKKNGENILQAPAREAVYKKLPLSGNLQTKYTGFEKPVLSQDDIGEIRKISKKLKEKLPNSPGIETSGPFDIELGFKDHKIWLFQVRPFVENKNAAGNLYLDSLDPKIITTNRINLNNKFE